MSVNKEIENLCWIALKDGPKLKREVNEFVVNHILSNKLKQIN